MEKKPEFDRKNRLKMEATKTKDQDLEAKPKERLYLIPHFCIQI